MDLESCLWKQNEDDESGINTNKWVINKAKTTFSKSLSTDESTTEILNDLSLSYEVDANGTYRKFANFNNNKSIHSTKWQQSFVTFLTDERADTLVKEIYLWSSKQCWHLIRQMDLQHCTCIDLHLPVSGLLLWASVDIDLLQSFYDSFYIEVLSQRFLCRHGTIECLVQA